MARLFSMAEPPRVGPDLIHDDGDNSTRRHTEHESDDDGNRFVGHTYYPRTLPGFIDMAGSATTRTSRPASQVRLDSSSIQTPPEEKDHGPFGQGVSSPKQGREYDTTPVKPPCAVPSNPRRPGSSHLLHVAARLAHVRTPSALYQGTSGRARAELLLREHAGVFVYTRHRVECIDAELETSASFLRTSPTGGDWRAPCRSTLRGVLL